MPTANDKGGVDMLTLKVYYDLEKKDQPVDPSKPDQPVDPSKPDQPADPGKPNQPTDPANGNSATNTNAATNAAAGTKTNNAVSPKTADISMLYVSIALFAVAASGLVVLVLKRKGNAR